MRPWVRRSAPTLKCLIAAARTRACFAGEGVSAKRSGSQDSSSQVAVKPIRPRATVMVASSPVVHSCIHPPTSSSQSSMKGFGRTANRLISVKATPAAHTSTTSEYPSDRSAKTVTISPEVVPSAATTASLTIVCCASFR